VKLLCIGLARHEQPGGLVGDEDGIYVDISECAPDFDANSRGPGTRAPTEFVSDPIAEELSPEVNGIIGRRGMSSDMIFSPVQIVHYRSRYRVLERETG
jgi:hypothetical protein